MNDEEIISLYNKRSERAIEETSQKYGGLCRSIAFGILRSDEDAEECVNDAYLAVWRSIPPEHPMSLSAYLSKITRNTALNRVRDRTAEKRGGTQYDQLLGELAECLVSESGDMVDSIALSLAINSFLSSLDPTTRMIFMRRYWYMKQTKEIAREFRLTDVNVRLILHRARKKLKEYLSREGIEI